MLIVNAYMAYAAEVRYLFICLSCCLAMLSFECFIMLLKAFSCKLICSKKCAAFSVSNAEYAQLYMLNPIKNILCVSHCVSNVLLRLTEIT